MDLDEQELLKYEKIKNDLNANKSRNGSVISEKSEKSISDEEIDTVAELQDENI